MSFVALWKRGDTVVAEDVFNNLIDAKCFVLDHLREKSEVLGITCVEVSGSGKRYFHIECPTQKMPGD